jgi:hypothetical protein
MPNAIRKSSGSSKLVVAHNIANCYQMSNSALRRRSYCAEEETTKLLQVRTGNDPEAFEKPGADRLLRIARHGQVACAAGSSSPHLRGTASQRVGARDESRDQAGARSIEPESHLSACKWNQQLADDFLESGCQLDSFGNALNLNVSCTWRSGTTTFLFIRAPRRFWALWGRLVACGRLSIGQMPLTSSTPRLRLAAMRGRLPACGRLSLGLAGCVQPPAGGLPTRRRMPSCPTCEQFHFQVAHPWRIFRTNLARAAIVPLRERVGGLRHRYSGKQLREHAVKFTGAQSRSLPVCSSLSFGPSEGSAGTIRAESFSNYYRRFRQRRAHGRGSLTAS